MGQQPIIGRAYTLEQIAREYQELVLEIVKAHPFVPLQLHGLGGVLKVLTLLPKTTKVAGW
jgi:hypothetical protein